ncbi:MAG TPA: hypothetical protein VED01_13075 [Burkholderiales bacterium]|nr:hypothetical protein [Burkholderiales bacterium]
MTLTDLLFTGAATVPATLVFAGRFEIAMLVFCALLVAACLVAAWYGEDVRCEKKSSRRIRNEK